MGFVIFVSVLWTLSNAFISCRCIDILVWPLPHSSPARSLQSVFPLIFFQPCTGWVTRDLLEKVGSGQGVSGVTYSPASHSWDKNGDRRNLLRLQTWWNDVWDSLTVTSELPSREWNFTNCFMHVQFKEYRNPQDFTDVSHHKNYLTYL